MSISRADGPTLAGVQRGWYRRVPAGHTAAMVATRCDGGSGHSVAMGNTREDGVATKGGTDEGP